MRGAQDLVERHPLRDEIDKAILSKSATADQLAARYDFSGSWVIYRRKKTLIGRMKARARKQAKADEFRAAAVQEKRTLRLLDSVLDASMQGYHKIMQVSESAADVERGATFLDRYLKSVELFGHATGEIPIGGVAPAVNVDNRQMYVMSLPRSTDGEEVLQRERLMIENLGVNKAVDITASTSHDSNEEDFDANETD